MWHDTEEDFNQEFGYDDDASYEHEHYNGLHHEPAEAANEEKKKIMSLQRRTMKRRREKMMIQKSGLQGTMAWRQNVFQQTFVQQIETCAREMKKKQELKEVEKEIY